MVSSFSSDRSVCVRFAPSPTGFLHIGGVRVALFNWLFARQKQGQFFLRIEDTDLQRSEERFTQDIIDSMKWLGLNWDQEPLFQSQRIEIYREKAEELVSKGLAYRCYCTEAQVEKMREQAIQEGKKPQYDRRCRNLQLSARQDQPFVIRAKIPLEGVTQFHDLIRGPIQFENEGLDDFVLIRSNGVPTYHLSVVVDDVFSKMTHILRGDDHINNTPKQVHLYQFFSYPVPQFAHLPMILGPDKKKLSKRHGAVSANFYRAQGFLPEALLNFLARLGWSHGDQEIFDLDEMVRFFSFEHVQKSSAVFNEEKLLWLNGAHIRKSTPQRLLSIVQEDYSDYFSKDAWLRANTPLGCQIVILIQSKVKLIKELAEQLVPLCTPGVIEVDSTGLKWNKDANLKTLIQPAIEHLIEILSQKMESVSSFHRSDQDLPWGHSPSLVQAGWMPPDIEGCLQQICSEHGVKLGDLTQPIRLMITGRLVSAGLFELLSLLPWDLVKARLIKVITL